MKNTMTEYPTHDDMTHWGLNELLHVMLHEHGPKKVLDVFTEVCDQEARWLYDKGIPAEIEEADAWVVVRNAICEVNVEEENRALGYSL